MGSPFESSDGILLLGILHEAIGDLTSSSGDAETFWSDAVARVRWLVPATRLVVWERDSEAFRTVVAVERGEDIECELSGVPLDHPWMRQPLKSPRWIVPPWRADDNACIAWLIEPDPKSILLCPVRSGSEIRAYFAFSITTSTGPADRTLVAGLSGIYSLVCAQVLAARRAGST